MNMGDPWGVTSPLALMIYCLLALLVIAAVMKGPIESTPQDEPRERKQSSAIKVSGSRYLMKAQQRIIQLQQETEHGLERCWTYDLGKLR